MKEIAKALNCSVTDIENINSNNDYPVFEEEQQLLTLIKENEMLKAENEYLKELIKSHLLDIVKKLGITKNKLK